MLQKKTAFVFVLAMFVSPCLAEDVKTPPLPDALAALKIEAVEKAWASFQEAQAKAKQLYVKALQAALEVQQKAGNLEPALAIKGEIDAQAASVDAESKAKFPPKSAASLAQQAFQKEIAAQIQAFILPRWRVRSETWRINSVSFTNSRKSTGPFSKP
jgi:hypothetical protein